MSRELRFLGISLCLLIMICEMNASCFAETGKADRFSLADCLQYAGQNSEKIKTAALGVEQSRRELQQATAGLWPTLGYEVYRTKVKPDSGIDYTDDNTTISLKQNLFTGGKLSASIKQGRLQLGNALENERQVKQQLTYDVKQAYYQMWLALQKLTVAQASYDNMGNRYHNLEKKYQEGLVPKIDLLQAEVNWRKLKPDVIAAKNEVGLCRSNLALLIGKPDSQGLMIETDTLLQIAPENLTIPLTTALETAYRNRPEMRQMSNNIELAQAGVASARAGYYPTLVLSDTYKVDQYDPSSLGDTKTWALTLDLSGTLFNGMATQANVAAAKIGVQKQLSSEKQLKDEIRLKLEQGLQTLEENIETIAVQRANRDLAQESLRLTQIKLDEGLATNADLLDAQLNVDEALNGYYQGICNYLITRANLDLLLGKEIE